MQIEENMFMQYFLDYSSFTNEYPFSATLFLEIRKRLDLSIINSISEIVVTHQKEIEEKSLKRKGGKRDKEDDNNSTIITESKPEEFTTNTSTNAGRIIMDASIAPQNITFPTDLKLLNATREKVKS